VQTIQLTAQIDAEGVLRVQMPDRLKNTTIDATIVFAATGNKMLDSMTKSNSPSLENSTATDRMSWQELVHSLAGAWGEDFPAVTEIRTESLDIERENL
jgi:Leucine-rich repeat (LRR) protein